MFRRWQRLFQRRYDTKSYPITLYTESISEEFVHINQQIDELASHCKWIELFDFLEVHKGEINSCKLPVKGENKPPSLYTPLHYAASGNAPKEVFEKLIKDGACKCLKTANGETAYDIAKSKGLGQAILKLLEIPKNVKDHLIAIEKMENGLHDVIKGRVEELIIEHGLSLPQLSFLFEKGSFFYSVPGMYGGFSVRKHRNGIQSHSFIRICGGSEEDHVIDREGNVTLLTR